MRPFAASRAATWLRMCATAGVLTLGGCQHVASVDPALHPPPDVAALPALPVAEWAGTYQGLLPCDDCPGIAMAVQLRPDKSVTIRERPVGGPLRTTIHGTLQFDPEARSIAIVTDPLLPPAARRFLLGEQWLELRTPDTGAPLADDPTRYRLRQTSSAAN